MPFLKKASHLQVIQFKCSLHSYQRNLYDEIELIRRKEPLGITSKHYLVLDHPSDEGQLDQKIYKV